MQEPEITLVSYFDTGARKVSITHALKTRPIFVIGSDSRCNLQLVDLEPAQALVHEKDGRCTIQPRFPNLEVLVNGQRITGAAVLQPGDRVQVGKTHLIFGQVDRTKAAVPKSKPTASQLSAEAVAAATVSPAPTVQPAASAREYMPNIYFPQKEEKKSQYSFVSILVGTFTFLAIIGFVGYALLNSLSGFTSPLQTSDPAFVSQEGQATLLMFDASW